MPAWMKQIESWLGWALLWTLALNPMALAGQKASLFEMSMEELTEIQIVRTASKYEQKVSEVPASVTIITADEIRLHGYRSLADVLDTVPGFYINNDRNYRYVGVRGFRRPGDYDSRVLVLMDGHRINENIGDGPGIGMEFPVDVELIDRVEVIQGPGSALYGSNALFAVINVMTKGGKQVQGLELSGQVGSLETRKGRVSFGQSLPKKGQLLVSVTGYSRDGQPLYFEEFDDPATANGWVDNDDESYHNFFAKASIGEVSLTAGQTTRNKGIPTAPWDTVFGDPRTRTEDQLALVGLTFDHALSDKTSLHARLAYHQYDYKGHWPYASEEEEEDPSIVDLQDSWMGQWGETEVQFISEPLKRHKLTWGMEGQYNMRQDQKVWDETSVSLDDRRHSHNEGVYIQDEFKIWNDLTLIGGLRYDYYDSIGGRVSPRCAALYHLGHNTSVKLLYGEAFRTPNVYELYYQDGDITQKASLDLRPETMQTYEVILEHSFHRNVRATLSGYYYILEDLIDQYLDPADGLLVFRNLGRVEAKGLEAGLEATLFRGIKALCSYSFVQATDETTGQTLVNSPSHLIKAHLTAPLFKDDLHAGLRLLYSSKAQTLSGSRADDFILANLVITHDHLLPGLEGSVGLYNLFNTEYGYPGAGEHTQDVINQDGFSVIGRLTYRFK